MCKQTSWRIFHLSPTPLQLFEEDIPATSIYTTEIITYDDSCNIVRQELEKQYDKLLLGGYDPKKVVIGVEHYRKLCAYVAYHNNGFHLIKEFMGMEITVIEEDYIKVVPSIQNILSNYIATN
ncbi:hypothetical protein [Brevibacillus laterosporus]|uniref:hypothetical protein n=1 Tax=Brevibacillus laterosporus TaxID=1465 RepID=UPI003D238172